MRVRDAFEVAAPIDRVFEFLADPRHLVGLDRNLVIAVEQLAGDIATYRLSGPKLRGPWLTEYWELDPPRRIRVDFRQESGKFNGSTSYDLEPGDGGTIVRMEGSGRVGPVIELGVMLVGPIYRWQLRRGHRKLATKIGEWARSSDIQRR